MTTISLAPEWAAGMRAFNAAAARAPDSGEDADAAAAAPPPPPSKTTVDVAVRQLRPGAFQAYVPATLQQQDADDSAAAERLRQTTWLRPTVPAPPGAALDVKA